jgi:hypothetical protein
LVLVKASRRHKTDAARVFDLRRHNGVQTCEDSIMWPLSVQLSLSLALSLAMFVAGVVAAWGFRHWRQQAECNAQRVFEQLDLIRAELMLLGDRVHSIEAPAAPVRERPAQVEVRAPALVASAQSAPRGYEIAARLARGGATCEELISSCGLSRHEAELLMRLNKAETARSKPAVSSAPLNTAPVKNEGAQRRSNEAMRARLAAVV